MSDIEKFWKQFFKAHKSFARGSRKFESERDKMQVKAERFVYNLIEEFERAYQEAARESTTWDEDNQSGYDPYEEGKKVLQEAFGSMQEEIAESVRLDYLA